nr:hypothetical protein [Tanacetum cinerariifolium]
MDHPVKSENRLYGLCLHSWWLQQSAHLQRGSPETETETNGRNVDISCSTVTTSISATALAQPNSVLLYVHGLVDALAYEKQCALEILISMGFILFSRAVKTSRGEVAAIGEGMIHCCYWRRL